MPSASGVIRGEEGSPELLIPDGDAGDGAQQWFVLEPRLDAEWAWAGGWGGGRERPQVEPIAGVVVWNPGSSACSGK